MSNDNNLLFSAYFIVLSPSGEKSATDAVAFLSWKKHIVINKEVNKCPSMQLLRQLPYPNWIYILANQKLCQLILIAYDIK